MCFLPADHRTSAERAADAHELKAKQKAEAALKAKQHDYEKEQHRLAEEQAVQAGRDVAARLQQARLGPTPTTAGTSKLWPVFLLDLNDGV